MRRLKRTIRDHCQSERELGVCHLLGNVTGIAVGCDTILKVSTVCDRTAVVDPSSPIEAGNVAVVLIGVGTLVDAVGKTIARGSPGGAVAHHLEDGGVRARVSDYVVVIARTGAVVVLHEPRVPHAVVGGLNANTTSRLLEDDCQNEAMVNSGFLRNLLDGVPDGTLAELLAFFQLYFPPSPGRTISGPELLGTPIHAHEPVKRFLLFSNL